MVGISIGQTKSGREILVSPNLEDGKDLIATFGGWTSHDKVDVILAVQCLILKEKRRISKDEDWYKTLNSVEFHLTEDLGETTFSTMKSKLGLHSAFAAREYGMSLLHPHFRC